MRLNTQRLKTFLHDMSSLMDKVGDNEEEILLKGGALVQSLVSHDDWLPDSYAVDDPERYTQHLLYCDPQNRFSVVSFVWGPGQSTPIHNHTVWGLVGMLRGSEISQDFELQNGQVTLTGSSVLNEGEVVAVSPSIGDIHKVSNAEADKVSISIHVYGADIGAINRSVFHPDGAEKSFISGYTNTTLPNIWGAEK